MTKRSSLPVAALAFELSVADGKLPEEFRLFPAGRFRAADGRTDQPAEGWLMNAAAAARIIAAAAARKSDYVLDYEHQTLLTEKNGQPAPAAAWFKLFEWREGDGLYVIKPRFTPAAAKYITGLEYRYVSPVFPWSRQTGEVLGLYHAALTNDPGLDGLTDFSALGARFAENTSGDLSMELLKKLFAAAGLAEPADEAAATAALAALKADATSAAALKTEVAALKAQNPDPAKFVSIETMQALQTQVAALSSQIQGSEVDGLVAQALTDGKLLPAQELWARELGKKDVAALKSYLKDAPVVSALAGRTQSDGKQLPREDGATEADLAVCKNMGISVEEYLKTKKASA